MIFLTQAQEINAILNLPDCREAGRGEVDIAPLVVEGNYFIATTKRDGVISLLAKGNGVYDFHVNIARTAQSRVVSFTKNVFNWMFLHTNCMCLQGAISRENERAHKFIKGVGAREDFSSNDSVFYNYTLWDWERYFRGEVGDSGMELFNKILHKVDGLDSALVPLLGVLLAFLEAGQIHKGVVLFNRNLAYFHVKPMEILNHQPLVLRVMGLLLFVEENSWQVVEDV